MIRRLFLTVAFCCTLLVVDSPDAEAARRRGLFSRIRANQSQRYTRSRTTSTRSKNYANKPHMTQSRSAYLDGFFGPYPGSEGHDASWYVGR